MVLVIQQFHAIYINQTLQEAASTCRQAHFMVCTQVLSTIFDRRNLHGLLCTNLVDEHCSEELEFAVPATSQSRQSRWPCC